MIVKPEYVGGGSPCANHSARSPSDRLDFQHLSKPPPANELHATIRTASSFHVVLVILRRPCGGKGLKVYGNNEAEYIHETRIVVSLLKRGGHYNSKIFLKSIVVLN